MFLTFLQLRTANNDLVIYQPYQSPIEGSKDTSLRFLKVPNPHLSKARKEEESPESQEGQEPPRLLRALHDVCGFSTVFMQGLSPSFIIKSVSSPPQVVEFCDSFVKSLSQLHTSTCRKGFLYIDGEVCRKSTSATEAC